MMAVPTGVPIKHITNQFSTCSQKHSGIPIHSPGTAPPLLGANAFSSAILPTANRRRRYKPATSVSRSTYRHKATIICASRKSFICCPARLSLALLKLTGMQGRGGKRLTGAA